MNHTRLLPSSTSSITQIQRLFLYQCHSFVRIYQLQDKSNKSVKTKQAAVQLLRDVVNVCSPSGPTGDPKTRTLIRASPKSYLTQKQTSDTSSSSSQASPRCLNDDALLTPLLEALKQSIHGDRSNSNLRMDTLSFLLAFISM